MSTSVNPSSRDQILGAIRASRPPAIPMPDIRAALQTRSEETLRSLRLEQVFETAARAAGAQVMRGSRRDGSAVCTAAYPLATQYVSTVIGLPGTRALPEPEQALADLELFVCEGSLGVAETGAVWLPASRIQSRAALLLARHVLLFLDCTSIVADLHDAYARIDISAESFGTFVAGPSKTADIEQSLVIGAQGPMGLTICLLEQV